MALVGFGSTPWKQLPDAAAVEACTTFGPFAPSGTPRFISTKYQYGPPAARKKTRALATFSSGSKQAFICGYWPATTQPTAEWSIVTPSPCTSAGETTAITPKSAARLNISSSAFSTAQYGRANRQWVRQREWKILPAGASWVKYGWALQSHCDPCHGFVSGQGGAAREPQDEPCSEERALVSAQKRTGQRPEIRLADETCQRCEPHLRARKLARHEIEADAPQMPAAPRHGDRACGTTQTRDERGNQPARPARRRHAPAVAR